MRLTRGYITPALILAALGCRPAETGSVRIDPALATLAPADSVLLAGVRFDKLRDTVVYQKWIAPQVARQLDELARNTGVDPRKDLWELLIASTGAGAVVMARGKFSPAGLEPKLEREGARRMPYKGYTLIGNQQSAVVFMNSSTAVAGPIRMLHTVIDQRNSRAAAPSALLGMTRTIPATSQLWVVSAGVSRSVQEAVPQTGNLANLHKVLALLETFTAAADLRAGISAAANGNCRNEQDARSLADAVRGLVALGRLSSPDNRPELLRVYDAIQVEQHQRSVRVTAAIPQELLDKLIPAGPPSAGGR